MPVLVPPSPGAIVPPLATVIGPIVPFVLLPPSVPPLFTATAPEPVVLLPPVTNRVPALMVVPPEYVLLSPESVAVPAVLLVRAPLPPRLAEIVPDRTS